MEDETSYHQYQVVLKQRSRNDSSAHPQQHLCTLKERPSDVNLLPGFLSSEGGAGGKRAAMKGSPDFCSSSSCSATTASMFLLMNSVVQYFT